MVSAVKKLFNRDSTGLSEAAFLIGFFSIVSQLLALVRDRALSHAIGPSLTLDVYYASFKIPDLLFLVIGTLVSVTAVLPFLMDKKKDADGDKKVSFFASELLVIVSGILIVLSLVGLVLMPTLVKFVAPGFDDATLAELVTMSRIMLISPTLLGISNLFGTFAQFYKKFFGFSLAPVLYNVGLIFGVLYLYPRFGLTGLAIGVVSGAGLHLLVQFVALGWTKIEFVLPRKINWREMYALLWVSLPRSFTISISSIVFVVLSAIATTMPEGSVSLLTLAFNLQGVPLGVIGVSYAVAAFPMLSNHLALGEKKEALAVFSRAYRHMTFWVFPAMALFIVLRSHIVRIILGTGAFTWENTRLVAAALGVFMIALFAQASVVLLIRVFYAAHDTKTPLFASVVSAVVSISASLVLISLYRYNPAYQEMLENILRIRDLPGAIVISLPIGFVLGSFVQALMLRDGAKKILETKKFPGVEKAAAHSLAGAICAAACAYGTLHLLSPYFSLETFFGVLAHGFLAGLVGILGYIAFLALSKSQELTEVTSAFKRKLKPAVILPDEIEGA